MIKDLVYSYPSERGPEQIKEVQGDECTVVQCENAGCSELNKPAQRMQNISYLILLMCRLITENTSQQSLACYRYFFCVKLKMQNIYTNFQRQWWRAQQDDKRSQHKILIYQFLCSPQKPFCKGIVKLAGIQCYGHIDLIFNKLFNIKE